MKPKIDTLREFWNAGERVKALAVAARFFDRSEETRLFQQAHGALLNESFYRQIGKDPQEIADRAFAALARKFKLPI